ncbi:MAG: intradiol ring-cleavage dioxygenase [Stackebrandtia sp.]
MNRRKALALGGGVVGAAGLGAAAIAGTAEASSNPALANVCELTTELTEGPYYVDLNMVRQDITEGKTAAPLQLKISVVETGACGAVPDAAVELWHNDYWGYYSSFTDHHPGGSVPPPDNVGDPNTFLRGIQLTGADGYCEFTTLLPGWYIGRCTHIHVKVHLGGTVDGDVYEGGQTVHTGQLFFDDEIAFGVDNLSPYNRHVGDHITLNEDTIYQGNGVKDGLLALTANDPNDPLAGYVGEITLGIRS